MKKLFCFSAFLLFCFSACTYQPKTQLNEQPKDSLSIAYATGFSVYYYDDFKKIVVKNPWNTAKNYAIYYLVSDSSWQVPSDGAKIVVPLKTLATSSTTHYGFLDLIDEIASVTGICEGKLVYNEILRQRIAEKKVVDLGDALNINLEKTLRLQPDILMMNAYNQNDKNAVRLMQAGLLVVFNNEWTENSLLGRAEWLKFVAAFYNKETLADSIFQHIEKKYLAIKEQVKKNTQKPTVMSGSNFRGTWYMPAGQSFMSQLFVDAGASYFYEKNADKGSLPLSVETVLKNFANTDFWLNCSFNTMQELQAADTKNALFKAAKINNVYNFNCRRLATGANDFFESAVAQPDLLLKDVAAILHPEIFPDYPLFYAKKVE